MVGFYRLYERTNAKQQKVQEDSSHNGENYLNNSFYIHICPDKHRIFSFSKCYP